jgi:hypothetical protein
MNDIKIQKTVFSATEFNKVVDRSFATFAQPVVEEDTDTIENFFRLYEKLYFEIDITGDTDSHEYLIRKSSELVDFDKNTEDIQPLLDEIAQLRTELLQANQQILNLETANK